MTARDVLAEIEQRADSHALAAGGIETASDPWFSAANWADKPHRLVFDLVGDNRTLVAALRAVLDLHRPIQVATATSVAGAATSITNATACHTCRIPGLPQWPCAEYRAITDALNGVTAGTDR